MIFIKKALTEKADEDVHRQFARYGKGVYENKALLTIKKGKNLAVKSSFEFANDFVKLIAENAKNEISVSGIILMFKEFKFREFEISKRGKVYKCNVDFKCTGGDLLKICEEFKDGWLLLNLKNEGYSLKCKNSLPKPGGRLKDDFCSAGFDIKLIDEFAWDVKNFNHLIIKHKYEIKEIEIPKEYANDFVKARYFSKRKGKMSREVDADGKVNVSEKEFIA